MFVFGLNAPKPTTASGPRPDTSNIKDSNPIFMGLGAAGRHDCSFRLRLFHGELIVDLGERSANRNGRVIEVEI